MGRQGKDLTDKIFGRWKVLYDSGKRDIRGYKLWNCKCECGKIKLVLSRSLVNGTSQSCGCLRNEKLKKANSIEKGRASLNDLFGKYKAGAKKRNHLFNLTIEEFESLTSSNCYYCDKPPNKKTGRSYYNGYYIYNGIDRVDNSKGYILNNCVPCCIECNHIKRSLPISMAKKMMEFIDKNSHVLSISI